MKPPLSLLAEFLEGGAGLESVVLEHSSIGFGVHSTVAGGSCGAVAEGAPESGAFLIFESASRSLD